MGWSYYGLNPLLLDVGVGRIKCHILGLCLNKNVYGIAISLWSQLAFA